MSGEKQLSERKQIKAELLRTLFHFARSIQPSMTKREFGYFLHCSPYEQLYLPSIVQTRAKRIG